VTPPGEETSREQAQSKQQVQAEGRAQQLCQVSGDRDHLGLQPKRDREWPPKTISADLGEVLAGRDPQLGAHGLNEHRDEVRRDHHPQQQVAVPGPAREIRREVSGIHISDRRNKCGTQERPNRPQAAPLPNERFVSRPGHSSLSRKSQVQVQTSARCQG
jgi:hypothetical protein